MIFYHTSRITAQWLTKRSYLYTSSRASVGSRFSSLSSDDERMLTAGGHSKYLTGKKDALHFSNQQAYTSSTEYVGDSLYNR